MGTLFFFIESIDIGLYILLGLLLIWNLRALLLSRGELRIAQFGLERELSQRAGGRSLTTTLVTIELLILVWAVSNIAAPTWRDGLPEDQQSVLQQRFATSTPGVLGSFDPIPTALQSGVDIIQTAPPPSTPKGTIVAPGGREGCTIDQAWIDFPDDGMLVFEPITVRGTASIADFAFYRFEIKADRAGANFAPIAGDNTQPVIDGPLGQLIPTNYLDGGYRFRLVVFDTSSTPRASCEITIFISPPVPTETPIGQ